MSKPEILVIEDEPQIRKLLGIVLDSNGYKVVSAASGQEGIVLAANHPPDLILLDLGLPDKHGHIVLQELRSWYQKGIIMLTVQQSEEDIVKALDNGASDYLTKPFRTGELLARIRSVMRRNNTEIHQAISKFGSMEIDYSNRTVRRNGEYVKLTPTEYNLLSLFAKNEGRVLTHHFLLKEVWGVAFQTETQYLRVFVAQLRKKLEDDPDQPQHLLTESGVGYRFI
jgi:two-component system KDP operon response regulator KdpE